LTRSIIYIKRRGFLLSNLKDASQLRHHYLSLKGRIDSNYFTSRISHFRCFFCGFGIIGINFLCESFAPLIHSHNPFHEFVCILEKVDDFTAADDLWHVCSRIEEKSGFCFSGGEGSHRVSDEIRRGWHPCDPFSLECNQCALLFDVQVGLIVNHMVKNLTNHLAISLIIVLRTFFICLVEFGIKSVPVLATDSVSHR
jgi:hypothetical protein